MTHTVVLVGCGSAKRDRYCAAKDLYTSTYFQKKRAYAEQYGDQWFILSAKHKLFHPDRWLAPYDKSMADVADPDQWARFVGGELHHQCNDITEDVEVIVLAGRDYSDPFRNVLEELNFEYRCPFDDTEGIGEQLAWLTERLDTPSDQERVMTDGGHCSSGIDRPAVCVDTLDYDGSETYHDLIEGQITRDYYECPSCGHPVSTWMDCPQCFWYDEGVWTRTLSDGGEST